MAPVEDRLIRTWSSFVPDGAMDALAEVLRSKWLNTGPREKLLREEFRRIFDVPYAVACSNGTAALRASYAAAGVGPGDEVVTTPFTFIATNTAILEQGAVPVFADIQYETLNLDPESVESKITKRTKAIVCVHYGGYPCDLDELTAVARRHRLPLIEDSAHALGSRYKGRSIGSSGDFVTFSFQAIKIVTSGDGGMIATADPDRYATLKKLVWYGVDREEKPSNLLDPLPEDLSLLGFKYNMNDITAALALAGLQGLARPLERRRVIGERYRREFSGLHRVRILEFKPDRAPNYQLFPVHVEDRPRFAAHMRERGVLVMVNNRRNDRYSIFGSGARNLPHTARADQDTLLIPIHADLSDAEIDQVVAAVSAYDRA